MESGGCARGDIAGAACAQASTGECASRARPRPPQWAQGASPPSSPSPNDPGEELSKEPGLPPPPPPPPLRTMPAAKPPTAKAEAAEEGREGK
jgi:hypothetical protein